MPEQAEARDIAIEIWELVADLEKEAGRGVSKLVFGPTDEERDRGQMTDPERLRPAILEGHGQQLIELAEALSDAMETTDTGDQS